MGLKNQENDTLSVRVADKEKCPCAKCKWGLLFGGWDESWCAKYPDGKPSRILYDNEECPYFKPIEQNKKFKNFKK